MNMIYLLLLVATLYLLRKASRRLPVWFANALAGFAILLAAVFIGQGMLHSVSETEMAVATLCLTGVPLAEAYWLSNKKIC